MMPLFTLPTIPCRRRPLERYYARDALLLFEVRDAVAAMPPDRYVLFMLRLC